MHPILCFMTHFINRSILHFDFPKSLSLSVRVKFIMATHLNIVTYLTIGFVIFITVVFTSPGFSDSGGSTSLLPIQGPLSFSVIRLIDEVESQKGKENL